MKYAILFVLLVLACTGCADPNIAEAPAKLCTREMSGFWWGLWNGWTAFISFFGSILDPGIAIYDVCNNGNWYDFGFWLGLFGFGSSSSSGVRRARRRR